MTPTAFIMALQAFLTLVPSGLLPYTRSGVTDRVARRGNTPYIEATTSVSPATSLHVSNSTDSLTTRCYGVYGCFSIDQPFLSLARPLNVYPLPLDVIMPDLCLYTRANPRRCQRLRVGDLRGVQGSGFRAGRRVKVLTHGYLEHGDKRWLKKMVQEFLQYDDLNVVVLDWLSASGPPYTQAVANIRLLGAILGHFLLDLKETVGVLPSHVHVVGHSLGAHLAGYTGHYLRARGEALGRITGLDPAEPYFEGTDAVVRLDATDATFVDVIHTDAGPILTGGLGMLQSVGHIDFYPNGGITMPGCGEHFVDSVAKEQGNIPYGLRRFIGCNHIRSYEYFTESINSGCPFLSIECGTWEDYWRGLCWQCGQEWARCARMGAHADTSLNHSAHTDPLHGGGSSSTSSTSSEGRKMYLITADDSPFCTYHHRVSVVMSFTRQARQHGGDMGVFYLSLFGSHGASRRIKLNQEEIFFEPGNVYTYMIGTADLGHLQYVLLEWVYVTAYYNPLAWRLLSQSVVYINRIHIDSIEMQERYEFCGLDMPFRSGTQRQLEWQPVCPGQEPPPGASILGTIINFDVEDTINNNIATVNSGLNSLGNGQLINNLASSANQAAREIMENAREIMENARRRIGVHKKRRMKDKIGELGRWWRTRKVWKFFGGWNERKSSQRG
ncbi:pancreatic triacylglycerol lipase-like isoform X2 [Panulirus ornatus]|uniref:pancreatic triacylglycerol lipase-like isoform X2 n=1 Tax=Panulirus ornatus TaxID=150431 RepID=UPI003A8B9064